MEDRIREIYSRYNDELKPLVAEQELRMSAFEEPLLLNLSKMFDFLSQALSSDKEEQRREILQKMDNILTISISQSYMYVATAIKEDIKRFEKENATSVMTKFDNGKFIGEYKALKKDIRSIDKRCKRDSENYVHHFGDYKESYQKCLELDAKIDNVNNTETLLHRSTNSWIWTVFGWLTSIYASLWAGKYAVKVFFDIIGK